jgi:peptide/nickel transport system permease protein
MRAYIIRRLLMAVVLLLIISVVVFLMVRALPGDPILMYASQEAYAIDASPERLAELRHKYGLDQPLPVQYVQWLRSVLGGSLGYSISLQTNVTDAIGESLPRSLYLGSLAVVAAILIGVPAGVISAVRRGKLTEAVVTSLANLGLTIPIFWLGLILIYVFGLYLHVLPVFGYTSPFKDLGLSLRQAVMPVFCLSIIPMAALARVTRANMLDVIQQDYMRTARSKGLPENLIIGRHGVRNVLIPIVTLAAMLVRDIIGGSVFVEMVFGVPGMGRLAVDGVLSRDYALVQGVVLIIAVIVVLVNLVADISYGWLDPRVRLQQ